MSESYKPVWLEEFKQRASGYCLLAPEGRSSFDADLQTFLKTLPGDEYGGMHMHYQAFFKLARKELYRMLDARVEELAGPALASIVAENETRAKAPKP